MNEDCTTKAAQHIARVGYKQDNKKILDQLSALLILEEFIEGLMIPD